MLLESLFFGFLVFYAKAISASISNCRSSVASTLRDLSSSTAGIAASSTYGSASASASNESSSSSESSESSDSSELSEDSELSDDSLDVSCCSSWVSSSVWSTGACCVLRERLARGFPPAGHSSPHPPH